MFEFDLGDDLELIVETARSFARDALTPKLREHEAARAVDASTRKAFEEIGLAGLELPESLSGAGLGTLARVVVNEALAAGDAGAVLALDRVGSALYPLLELGGEDAVRELALPLLSGDGARAVLVADADANLVISGDKLTGTVPWVPADRVDLLVLLTRDGACAVREGIELESVRGSGLRAAGASGLRLEGAPIVAKWQDAAAAARALARARLYNASLLLGVLYRAAEFSREYALERQAFGKPIAHHQGLAFLIVDMRAAVDGARLLIHEAAWRIDQGLAGTATAAAAFAETIDAAELVGPNGVQILGGHGFMQDYPVEKFMRESRLLGLTLGGIDAARDDVGSAIIESGSGLSLTAPELSERAAGAGEGV